MRPRSLPGRDFTSRIDRVTRFLDATIATREADKKRAPPPPDEPAIQSHETRPPENVTRREEPRPESVAASPPAQQPPPTGAVNSNSEREGARAGVLPRRLVLSSLAGIVLIVMRLMDRSAALHDRPGSAGSRRQSVVADRGIQDDRTILATARDARFDDSADWQPAGEACTRNRRGRRRVEAKSRRASRESGAAVEAHQSAVSATDEGRGARKLWPYRCRGFIRFQSRTLPVS